MNTPDGSHGKNGKERLVVLETKGDQLAGNLDTTYKRRLLDELSKTYKQDEVIKAGELQLVSEGKEVVCDLVLMSEMEDSLPPATRSRIAAFGKRRSAIILISRVTSQETA